MAKAHKCHKTLTYTVWDISGLIPGVSKEKLVNCLKSAAMEFDSLYTFNTRVHVLYWQLLSSMETTKIRKTAYLKYALLILSMKTTNPDMTN